ncbi:Thaumatin family [Dillenia turbinata]|uniref:Thaumatin family n=1 Tax=Dillenia turbinata TaxID=194707 RepID=A0AAN8UYM5_9MAGN
MNSVTITCFLVSAAVLLFTSAYSVTSTTTFLIQNNCSYTIWAAASPGGGKQLISGQRWLLPADGSTTGHIWARTGCSFNESGYGGCQTGDCGGLLNCHQNAQGSPPYTLAEYTVNGFGSKDFFDISLVNGFNLPMEFGPIPSSSNGCTQLVECSADINAECPRELRVLGGCNNPCSSSGSNCGPSNYTTFFKDRCPNAYSYPLDDANTTFTCPTGTNYKVVFCPSNAVLRNLTVFIRMRVVVLNNCCTNGS